MSIDTDLFAQDVTDIIEGIAAVDYDLAHALAWCSCAVSHGAFVITTKDNDIYRSGLMGRTLEIQNIIGMPCRIVVEG